MNNPLKGKVSFDVNRNLCFEKGVKPISEFNPKVTMREWIYLFFDAAKGTLEDTPNNHRFIKKVEQLWTGSPVTQWRTKKSLTGKGYL